ncbi:hypothetical protein [Flavobacterium terrisoli]|uniref:hypothetical protein n=1 Tax=Flavobacterium terrisoli TaxID=3242195 RepID=UPI002542C667|nr:hypothetical protein [Flavobacterium buctense]
MKNLFNLRSALLAFTVLLLFSCGSSYYANHGTASDRTGTNGATNGNGKAPRGTSHSFTGNR